MKKLLLIASMFLAMNAWSESYYVCQSDESVEELALCVNEYLKQGYKLHGDMIATDYGKRIWYQPMYHPFL